MRGCCRFGRASEACALLVFANTAGETATAARLAAASAAELLFGAVAALVGLALTATV